MEELAAIERIKRLEKEANIDPRKKLALLMYKAKRKIDQDAKAKTINVKGCEPENKLFNP